MKLSKNEAKKIVMYGNKISHTDYSGQCCEISVTDRRTEKGWSRTLWSSCGSWDNLIGYMSDKDMYKYLMRLTYNKGDHPLYVDEIAWSLDHPINKMEGGGFRSRSAKLPSDISGWNPILAEDTARILERVEVSGSISCQRVEYGWIHCYSKTRKGWQYRRYEDDEIIIKKMVSYAEVYHWIYDALKDYAVGDYYDISLVSKYGDQSKGVWSMSSYMEYFELI